MYFLTIFLKSPTSIKPLHLESKARNPSRMSSFTSECFSFCNIKSLKADESITNSLSFKCTETLSSSYLLLGFPIFRRYSSTSYLDGLYPNITTMAIFSSDLIRNPLFWLSASLIASSTNLMSSSVRCLVEDGAKREALINEGSILSLGITRILLHRTWRST